MRLHIPALFLAASLLTGCNTSGARYTFVYLKTGPESAHKTKEESSAIFAGHMSNMKRLAEEHKLVVAGPFAKPADTTWRGIFILDVADANAARELVKTDPGIQSGVFIQEDHPFESTPDLRKTYEIEQKMNANAEPAKPGEPPKNIRGYVMITAADAGAARKALASCSISKSIIFSGRFSDTGAGVFIIGAAKPQEVQDALKGERIDLGACSIDGWWSSTCLMGLKKPAS